MKRNVYGLMLYLGVIIALFAVGCGGNKSDLAILKDTKGLTPGAKVVWNGKEVGTVTAIRPAIPVEFVINKTARADMRKGITATPSVDQAGQPILELLGGTGEGVPLPEGSLIPEANVVAISIHAPWFKWVLIGGGVLFALIVLLVIVVKVRSRSETLTSE